MGHDFLQPTGVEEFEFDRVFDVTLGFFLLESLTEWQALAFLDPLHGIAEGAFQKHALPHRMAWQVFFFSPR